MSPTSITPRLLAALLAVCALPAVAGARQGPEPRSPERPPHVAARPGLVYAVPSTAGGYELWTVDEALRAPRRRLGGVSFLPLRLVGYPLKDRLRLDRPAEAGAGSPAPHARLVGGGALYRISLPGETALLLVREGRLRVLLTVPDGPSGAGLADAVHVSPDGERALVATSLEAGGDVLVVPLGDAAPPVCVTHELPPLEIAAESLRVGASHVFFVADDLLHRGSATGTSLESVPLAPEPIHPELVLASAADAVAASAVQDDGKTRIFVVPASGPPEVVTDFDHYSLASDAHPLGPFLALSPTAEFVAYREERSGGKHELFLHRLATTNEATHITRPPEFPGYVDNVGAVVFGAPDLLCFFGGDSKKSDVVADEELGAADMYSARLFPDDTVLLTNVTRTNRHLLPPFVQVSDMRFSSVVVGPEAQRIYVGGTRLDGRYGISSFLAGGGSGTGENADDLLLALSGPPSVTSTTAGPVVLAVPADRVPASRVECAGDPALEPLVRIRASNKANPDDGGAKVWFDGPVGLGESFQLLAANAGEQRLSSTTYVHVFDPADQLLQTVELKTDCSQPILAADRFGAAELVAYGGEYGDPHGVYDYCASGGDLQVLVVQYTGDGCDATAHGQDPSKVECTGDPLAAPVVDVLATDKEDPDATDARVWFEGPVVLDEAFEIDALNAGESKLRPDTWVHVRDPAGTLLQTVRFHTSCSQPFASEDRFGSLLVVDALLVDEPDLRDLCVAGRPASLVLRYTGESCELRDLGPRVYALGPEVQQAEPASLPSVPVDELFPAGTLAYDLVTVPGTAQALFVVRTPLSVNEVYRLDAATDQLELLYQGFVTPSTLGFTAGGRPVLCADGAGGYELLRVGLAAPLSMQVGAAAFPLAD